MFLTSKDLVKEVDYDKITKDLASNLLLKRDFHKQVKANLLKKFKHDEKLEFRDWTQNVVLKDMLRKAGRQILDNIINNTKISIEDLLKVASMYNGNDKSVQALELFLIKKLGVDEKAKEYWIKYWGDYGRALTEDYKDKMKKIKLGYSELIKVAEFFKRNFGEQSEAVEVIKTALGYSIGKALYGIENTSDEFYMEKEGDEEDYISLDVVHDVIKNAGKDSSGKLVREVFVNIIKNAVDEKAKKYWIKYLGDYGEKLTRSYKDILKRRKVAGKFLREMHSIIARNHGYNSEGAVLLRKMLNSK